MTAQRLCPMKVGGVWAALVPTVNEGSCRPDLLVAGHTAQGAGRGPVRCLLVFAGGLRTEMASSSTLLTQDGAGPHLPEAISAPLGEGCLEGEAKLRKGESYLLHGQREGAEPRGPRAGGCRGAGASPSQQVPFYVYLIQETVNQNSGTSRMVWGWFGWGGFCQVPEVLLVA